MAQRTRLRRRRWWVAALCVAVLLGLLAAPTASAAPRDACDTQVNDTPSKLLPCITKADLWKHMQRFQAIADANPSPADGHPSRNSGEPGYKASADYVAQVMRDAGYNVTIQQYAFTYYAYTGIPSFSETSPTPRVVLHVTADELERVRRALARLGINEPLLPRRSRARRH